jgi:hypothetical protein
MGIDFLFNANKKINHKTDDAENKGRPEGIPEITHVKTFDNKGGQRKH